MSPSKNSFWACWAEAAGGNATTAANNASAENFRVFMGAPSDHRMPRGTRHFHHISAGEYLKRLEPGLDPSLSPLLYPWPGRTAERRCWNDHRPVTRPT